MKALYINEKGSDPVYDNLDFQGEDGQIKVKMLASALNHRDLWIIKGQYAGLKYPIVLGSDGTGVYNDRRVLINPSHNWGDDQKFQGPKFIILGLPDHGTMAEYCYVEEKYLYEAPEYLSDDEAAALPLAGLTAFRALFIQGSGQRGQKLLVTGIGGGVALFLLQFSVVAGLEVYVTSGYESKIKKAVELGAIAGFNYKNDLWAKQALETAGAFDLIIDGTGGDGFANLPGIVKPGGKIVNYGGTRGKINNLIPQTIFWKQISIIGSTMGSDKDFKDMLDFVTKHKIRPVIDSIHNIEVHKNAFDKMDSGSQFGKIVLKNS
jgi:NADPH:quinone reductase-like Zn-dependent oxidoreductase